MIGRLANGFYEGFFFVGWLDGLVFSSPTQFCGASVTILIGPPGIYYIYSIYRASSLFGRAQRPWTLCGECDKDFCREKKKTAPVISHYLFSEREIDAKWSLLMVNK